MLTLDEKEKDKLRKEPEIVKRIDVAGVLNGSPETFELYKDLLKVPSNIPLLEKHNTIECGTYLLLKNN